MRIGQKKTKKNLRENETIEYAETIEKSTKKNLMVIKRLISRNLENRTHSTMLGNNTVRNTKE